MQPVYKPMNGANGSYKVLSRKTMPRQCNRYIRKVGPDCFNAILTPEEAFLTIEVILVSFYSITLILTWHGGWHQIILIVFECTIRGLYSHVFSFLEYNH